MVVLPTRGSALVIRTVLESVSDRRSSASRRVRNGSDAGPAGSTSARRRFVLSDIRSPASFAALLGCTAEPCRRRPDHRNDREHGASGETFHLLRIRRTV